MTMAHRSSVRRAIVASAVGLALRHAVGAGGAPTATAATPRRRG